MRWNVLLQEGDGPRREGEQRRQIPQRGHRGKHGQVMTSYTI
jgi:hypothetical protein